MNGKGKMQSGGRVPTNDFRGGRGDEEACVVCLGSDSEESFVTPWKASRSEIAESSTTLHL